MRSKSLQVADWHPLLCWIFSCYISNISSGALPSARGRRHGQFDGWSLAGRDDRAFLSRDFYREGIEMETDQSRDNNRCSHIWFRPGSRRRSLGKKHGDWWNDRRHSRYMVWNYRCTRVLAKEQVA